MSWSIDGEKWKHAVDSLKLDEDEGKPVHICSNCDEPIYEGEEYYDIPTDGIYCEKCVSDWKYTAWRN